MHDDPRPESISVAGFISAMRRRWYLVAICALIAGAVAYVLSKQDETTYRAAATLLYVNTDENAQIGAPVSGRQPADQELEQATITSQLKLPVIARRTSQALKGGYTQTQVSDAVETSKGDAGDSFEVAAKARNPEAAAQIANAYAAQFVAYRIARDKEPLDASRRELERTLQEQTSKPLPADPTDRAATINRRNALRDRIDGLRTLARLQDGNIQLAQRAAPGSLVASNQKRNALIGLAFGLLVGSLLALFFDTLDRRIRSVGTVGDVFEGPLLGAIPRSRGVAVEKGGKSSGVDREAFQMLRANIRYANDNQQPRSVVVTSSGQGEGKTTVAWNLAVAAAEAGDRVLLIEADLRQPVLAKRSGVHARDGLAGVLNGDIDLQDAIEHLDTGKNGKTAPRGIDVLFAGATIGNPVDVLESQRMADLVRTAEARYDLVVIDTPPLTVVPDAMPLIRAAAGVVVVSRVGKTTSDAANRLRDQLEHVGARVLGVVANSVPPHGGYDYGYGYSRSGSYAGV